MYTWIVGCAETGVGATFQRLQAEHDFFSCFSSFEHHINLWASSCPSGNDNAVYDTVN